MSRLILRFQSLLVGASVATAALADPSIQITSLPAYATSGSLHGVVTGISNFADYGVATYIHIEGGGWWTKPAFANPTVPINSNGTYSVPVVTGGIDDRATIFATMLVPTGSVPPKAEGRHSLPKIPGAASDWMLRPSRTITFGGYDWAVKESPIAVGPGSNRFSNLPSDVWVDGDGQLHLTVSNHNGQWWATEVFAQKPLGYGRYVFQTNSRVDTLDPSATFGAFTWDAFGGGGAGSPNRELDVEDSRWGNAGDTNNSQFVVQPFGAPGNLIRYEIPDLSDDPALTRIIDWNDDGIHMIALTGHHLPGEYTDSDVIFEWSYTGEVPTPGQAVPRLNLWLTNGSPASALPQEVIVSNFIYLPVPESSAWLSLTAGLAVLALVVPYRRRRLAA